MKKLIAIILIACAALTLASCGSGIKVERGEKTETEETSRPKATAVQYPYKKEDSRFEYTIFEDSVTISGINGDLAEIEIPSEHESKPVTAISKECDMTGVSVLKIPESVTVIADEIFNNNATLRMIVINSPITALPNDFFLGCTALTDVVLPQTLTEIGLGAFEGCTSLQMITIPESVSLIGESAFKGCTSLESVSFTPNMTTVENFCFKGCTALTSVTIPDNIVYIGKSAFEDCTSLSDVAIPETITMVDQDAFSGTKWIDSFKSEFVIIGDGNLIVYKPTPEIVTVETEAPAETEGADGETTSAPAETQAPVTIKKYPSKVTIPNSVKRIMGAFAGHTEISSVYIPDSVIEISTSAFKGCTDIYSITIPDSVKSIGDSAFEGCTGLSSLTVPTSVEVVRDRAFANSGLKSIIFGADISQIGNSVFEGLYDLTVTCPDGSDMMYYCQYNNIPVVSD
ncbi:MAG: leucine-rich repeat domain-containing protein [Clostridia bacterium]|nr:leucine-rich repeat domain-containing protein [Clostridia bacterium]